MVLTTFPSEALDGLCSKERLDLMDSIDNLRSQGINHFVSLPQIIVCGDQSSGKSSVLEAISGVSFPVKSSLCTRFPTELVLRRAHQASASVSIVPHHTRSDTEKAALGSFHEELQSFDGLSNLIDNAKSAMGISTHGKAFAKDLLRVEISGPDRPHLTIVDLPGLIHSQTKNQSASDVGLIQEVVESYMKEPRSIILAVVSAKNDFANQVVLKLARSADTTGNRTIGVITKPDTLHPGSESESLYVSLARNQEVEFRLGWHVLKNLDSEAGFETLAQRDIRELEFFNRGIWKELSESVLGVTTLRSRLSKVLLNHITTELPSLIGEIEAKRNACQERLEKLGKPRTTLHEQQLHLIGISESFQRLVQSAVDGNWNDLFFYDAGSHTGYLRRIRAVVQNLNDQFAENLSSHGHRRHITDSREPSMTRHGISLTRVEFIDHIENKIRRSRGRELPGLFHPMIVADLFRDQASPWEELARSHVHNTWKACRIFLKHALGHVADAGTSSAVMHKIVQPAMETILATLKSRTGQTLRPHQMIHPITYNHYFTDTIQNVRKERERGRVTRALLGFFGVPELGNHHCGNTDLNNLLKVLVDDFAEPDMHRFAASEALDQMNAYYKVSLKRFLDDIAVEVIEVVLMSALPAILSPVKVYEMAPDLVARIAGETEEVQTMRNQLMRQLAVLSSGAETCKQFATTKLSVDEELVQDDEEEETDDLDEIKKKSAVDSNLSSVDSPSSPPQAHLAEIEQTSPEDLEQPVADSYWGMPDRPKKSSKKTKKKVSEWN
ncbi:P-loop containing nucleoside triphosphate hydrolase protein [Truncatella angustata]|uniref:P-loop containing nucleoside triphosphate hydrolase protein n=1 Tax=Truncatella angustata TaxID=152316 RepID=A0A9P8UNJ6_9PEZI|nr:P-loop containing nucleoside triphosphate hydrolase protein [Truncatella angustata]KAH6655546.1 P-loop containing nucleoside triphosphate hydrolase protein [Truncatella angustata]